MKKLINAALIIGAILAMPVIQGCASSVKASSTQNPPPAEAFQAYGRIEVRPTMFRAGYIGNEKAMKKIDDNLVKDLAQPLSVWNKRADNGRKLVIQPVVDQIDFSHGATRVMLGPLSGGSGVLMRLEIVDEAGRKVANPEFLQTASAWAGGFTMGVHDGMMLTRVANLASTYIVANYGRAVGGPTGAGEKNRTN